MYLGNQFKVAESYSLDSVVGSGISIFRALPNNGLNTHRNCAARRDVLYMEKKKRSDKISNFEKAPSKAFMSFQYETNLTNTFCITREIFSYIVPSSNLLRFSKCSWLLWMSFRKVCREFEVKPAIRRAFMYHVIWDVTFHVQPLICRSRVCHRLLFWLVVLLVKWHWWQLSMRNQLHELKLMMPVKYKTKRI